MGAQCFQKSVGSEAYPVWHHSKATGAQLAEKCNAVRMHTAQLIVCGAA